MLKRLLIDLIIALSITGVYVGMQLLSNFINYGTFIF